MREIRCSFRGMYQKGETPYDCEGELVAICFVETPTKPYGLACVPHRKAFIGDGLAIYQVKEG